MLSAAAGWSAHHRSGADRTDDAEVCLCRNGECAASAAFVDLHGGGDLLYEGAAAVCLHQDSADGSFTARAFVEHLCCGSTALSISRCTDRCSCRDHSGGGV